MNSLVPAYPRSSCSRSLRIHSSMACYATAVRMRSGSLHRRPTVRSTSPCTTMAVAYRKPGRRRRVSASATPARVSAGCTARRLASRSATRPPDEASPSTLRFHTSPDPIIMRVIIADDEPLSRPVVEQLLERHEDVQIVSRCADGEEVRDAIEEHRPDVVFLDIRM